MSRVVIVSSGRGYLTLIVWVVSIIAFVFILPQPYRNDAMLPATFITGIFNLFFGALWNKGKIVVDEETGEQFISKNGHTFFWIPMQYWGWIFCIASIYFIYQYSFTLSAIATGIFILFLVINFVKKGANKNDLPANLKSTATEHEKQRVQW